MFVCVMRMSMVAAVAHGEFFLLVIPIMGMPIMVVPVPIVGMPIVIVSIGIMRMAISIVGMPVMIVSIGIMRMPFTGFNGFFRVAVARIVSTGATHKANGGKEENGE